MLKKTIRDKSERSKEILYGMAKGPWANFWAGRQEEKGWRFSGMNIYDLCPDPPRAAKTWARRVEDKIVELNEGLSLEALYLAARHDGFSQDRENFGFYLGCEASGMGIRWDDDLVPNLRRFRLIAVNLKIAVPYSEFYI